MTGERRPPLAERPLSAWPHDTFPIRQHFSRPAEQGPARVCEILVGLLEVNVLGVDDSRPTLEIYVECRTLRPGCPKSGVRAHLKDQRIVTLVSWRCPDADCTNGSWTEEDDRIAGSRLAMTDRVGRWITAQVGRCARSVNEVAKELGCDWHNGNEAVVAYGKALVDHPDRFATVE